MPGANRQIAPEPSRVSDNLVNLCRGGVESRLKSMVRKVLLPFVKRKLGVQELGEGFQWGFPIKISRGSRVGRYVYIGSGFDSASDVSIGDLSMVAAGCKIAGQDHRYDCVGIPTRLAFAADREATVIGADVWVGLNVILRAGITIGDGAVIGAGSVVVKDVAPYSVVAGVPARTVRHRFSEADLIRHLDTIEK